MKRIFAKFATFLKTIPKTEYKKILTQNKQNTEEKQWPVKLHQNPTSNRKLKKQIQAAIIISTLQNERKT